MSSEKRAPTEATVKVDPSIEIHKTLYPYINYKEGGLTPYAGTSDILKRFNQESSRFNEPLRSPTSPNQRSFGSEFKERLQMVFPRCKYFP
jgi:hypothetical protein